MITSKLTERWQTTIPKAVRKGMRLEPGMRIQWEIQKDGTAIVRPEKSPLAFFESLKGEKVSMPSRGESYTEVRNTNNHSTWDHPSDED